MPGISPLFVPNADFSRIDTALTVPQVDPAGWSLQVKGRVERPLSFTYAELMAMPEIDGGLVGGASLDPDDFARIVRYGTT